jgi:hypothetical protein
MFAPPCGKTAGVKKIASAIISTLMPVFRLSFFHAAEKR